MKIFKVDVGVSIIRINHIPNLTTVFPKRNCSLLVIRSCKIHKSAGPDVISQDRKFMCEKLTCCNSQKINRKYVCNWWNKHIVHTLNILFNFIKQNTHQINILTNCKNLYQFWYTGHSDLWISSNHWSGLQNYRSGPSDRCLSGRLESLLCYS